MIRKVLRVFCEASDDLFETFVSSLDDFRELYRDFVVPFVGGMFILTTAPLWLPVLLFVGFVRKGFRFRQ